MRYILRLWRGVLRPTYPWYTLPNCQEICLDISIQIHTCVCDLDRFCKYCVTSCRLSSNTLFPNGKYTKFCYFPLLVYWSPRSRVWEYELMWQKVKIFRRFCSETGCFEASGVLIRECGVIKVISLSIAVVCSEKEETTWRWWRSFCSGYLSEITQVNGWRANVLNAA